MRKKSGQAEGTVNAQGMLSALRNSEEAGATRREETEPGDESESQGGG